MLVGVVALVDLRHGSDTSATVGKAASGLCCNRSLAFLNVGCTEAPRAAAAAATAAAVFIEELGDISGDPVVVPPTTAIASYLE